PETHALSDSVCTALQLANFWQDVAVDLGQDRVYLPLEDQARHGVTEDDLRAAAASPGVRALLADEVAWTRELFRRGFPVADRVSGRLALELRFTCWGGVRVLERIAAQGFDTLAHRPKLGPLDWVRILARVAA